MQGSLNLGSGVQSHPFLVVCSGSPPPCVERGHGASYFCQKQPLTWALLPRPGSAATFPPGALGKGLGGKGFRAHP